jgi:hypothetical protein
MSGLPVRIVVTDTNVLVNLFYVSRLDLCGRIPGHEFILPEHVLEETDPPCQITPCHQELLY